MQRLFVSQYRLFLALSAGSALFLATYGTLSAVYRIQEAGLNPLQLVLVGTVLEASVFLFEVPTGVLADSVSRRLSIIIGMIVMGVGFSLEGSIPVFGWILIAQVIWGLGYTFTSGAVEAWISDELKDDELTTRAFLRATQLRQVGALVGIVCSVALATVSLGLPLVVGGAGHLAIGGLLFFVMTEAAFVRSNHPTTWRSMGRTLHQGLGIVRRSKVILAMFGATFFLGAFSETFDRLWEAHLLSGFEFPPVPAWSPIVWFGVIDAGALLLSLAATEGTRRWINSASSARVPAALIATIGLLTAAVVGLGVAGEFYLAVAFYQAAVLVRIVHAPLLKAWLNSLVESRSKATVFSMHGQSDAIGQLAGGPALGWIATVVSLRVAFVVAGLILLPAGLLYVWGATRSGRAKEGFVEQA